MLGEIMPLHTNENYKKMIDKRSERSPLLKNCIFAFLIGGSLCLFGELLFLLYSYIGIEEKNAATLVTVSVIFLAALLTAVGLFDRIARYAGAGTLLPVTGFSNATVSPAMDAKYEGFIMGVGAKVFTVCGPVILYGTLASVLYGFIFYIFSLF